MEFDTEKYHLKSSSFFEALTSGEAALIKRRILRKEFKKGQVLFKEGTYSKGVYIVKKGKIKIYQTNSEGKQSIVYLYRRGDRKQVYWKDFKNQKEVDFDLLKAYIFEAARIDEEF